MTPRVGLLDRLRQLRGDGPRRRHRGPHAGARRPRQRVRLRPVRAVARLASSTRRHGRALAVPQLLPRRGARHRERPGAGRVLFVSNHSGQLPFDGLVIGARVLPRAAAAAPRARDGRVLRADRAVRVATCSRAGARSPARPRTAAACSPPRRRCSCFPRARAASPSRSRSATSSPSSARASCGSRSRRGAPIVPVAVIGAEEQAPAVNVKPLAKLLGMPAFPVVPYPPFVAARAAAGEVPALLRRADALHRRSRRRRRGARRARSRRCKHRIQSMIHVGLREREHVFW